MPDESFSFLGSKTTPVPVRSSVEEKPIQEPVHEADDSTQLSLLARKEAARKRVANMRAFLKSSAKEKENSHLAPAAAQSQGEERYA